MENLFVIAVGMFITGFVDAVAGGGGVISVPILMWAGLPVKVAIATNKIGGMVGNSTTSYNYYKRGMVDVSLFKRCALLALAGAVIGARLLKYIPSELLERGIPYVLMLLVAYTMLSKGAGVEDRFRGYTPKNKIAGMVLVFVVGLYNGFFGPASGSFLTMGLIAIYGFDFLRATGTSKPLNLMMTFSSGIILLLMGGVDLRVGVICALFRSLGGRAGSNFAVRAGSKVVKPIFIGASSLVIVKMLIF